MRELTIKETYNIIGGSISGSVLSGIAKGIELIFELGRSLGSGIRRLISKKLC